MFMKKKGKVVVKRQAVKQRTKECEVSATKQPSRVKGQARALSNVDKAGWWWDDAKAGGPSVRRRHLRRVSGLQRITLQISAHAVLAPDG